MVTTSTMIAGGPTGIGLGLRGAFAKQIARGDADGRIDFIEVAPENYMRRGGTSPQRLVDATERFTVLTHGLMMSLGATDPLDDDYFATLRAFLDRIDAPWHSDHLCFSGHRGAMLHDLLPVPFRSVHARRIADRVRQAQERLGRPMAIENISWYLHLGEPSYAETDFVNEVLDRADCGLLLDVNNVFVNATNHDFDPYGWLDEMPLHRVVQIHVAGHESWDDGTLLVDTHGASIRQEVHALLAWVLERTGPRPVLLERDSNIPPLPELLDEVDALRVVYDAALAAGGCRPTPSPPRAHV